MEFKISGLQNTKKKKKHCVKKLSFSFLKTLLVRKLPHKDIGTASHLT